MTPNKGLSRDKMLLFKRLFDEDYCDTKNNPVNHADYDNHQEKRRDRN
jgi:hypothetical protein